jgi:Protein of unknown function (DUF2934)
MEGQHMSRVATPQTAQPNLQQLKIPHEKIAMRAYEKWIKKGRPQGSHVQDWVEAEQELKAEFARGYTGAAPTQPQQAGIRR